MDIIPPSLALAQSAEESGWGTSRFAQEGNALFGQRVWVEHKKGLVGGLLNMATSSNSHHPTGLMLQRACHQNSQDIPLQEYG